jgi:hypothetical protein
MLTKPMLHGLAARPPDLIAKVISLNGIGSDIATHVLDTLSERDPDKYADVVGRLA